MMREIAIDGSKWKVGDDVYDDLLAALRSPDWHGRNLDALWDSISGDDLNGVKAPYRVVLSVSASWPADVRQLVSKIESIFKEASESGVEVGISLVE